MIQISSKDKEQELKTYCQKWLSYLANSDFDSASSMIDSPNCYGLSWGKQEIIEALINYFGETMEFHIQKVDLSECSPCYLERNDGGLLYESIIIFVALASALIYCGYIFNWASSGLLMFYAGLTGSAFGFSVVYAFSIPQSKIIAKHMNIESIKNRLNELRS